MSEDVPRRRDEKQGDYHSHARGQPGVHSRRGFDSLDVEQGKNRRKENRPGPVRHTRRKHMSLLTDPDDADHRIQHVIHHHAPAGYITERRIYFLANIGEG